MPSLNYSYQSKLLSRKHLAGLFRENIALNMAAYEWITFANNLEI